MTITRNVWMIATFAAAFIAFQPAQAAKGSFSVEYIAHSETHYEENRDLDDEGRGFGLGANVGIGQYFYVFGELDSVKYNDNGPSDRIDNFSAGFGVVGNPDSFLSFYTAISLENLDVHDLNTGRENEFGFGFRGGIIFNFGGWVWIHNEFGFIDVDDVDLQRYTGSLRFRITRAVGIYAEYFTGDYDFGDRQIERQGYRAGVYFKFGEDEE